MNRALQFGLPNPSQCATAISFREQSCRCPEEEDSLKTREGGPVGAPQIPEAMLVAEILAVSLLPKIVSNKELASD
jgi:hypothetical protein